MWVPYVMTAIVMLVLLVFYAIMILGIILIGDGIFRFFKESWLMSLTEIILGTSFFYISKRFRRKFIDL